MENHMASPRAQEKSARGSFSGRIGYVLSVAGSAVGLGNIWRFPYLAAKYGGGMFILTYIVLTVTFGYTLIVSETALGRMTGKGPVGAFKTFGKSFPYKFGGWLNAVVAMLIVPYYCVIGGWVLKYAVEYIRGNGAAMAADGMFSSFLANSAEGEVYFIVFALLCVLVILGGVRKGVEQVSKIMMPVLIVLAIGVAVYSMTRPGAMEGVKYLLIPDWAHFSMLSVIEALGQMFYSLSIAMGVLYTYGSYLKKDVDIDRSTTQIEVFDTGVALLGCLMIIPSVFAYSNGDLSALQAGPSLTFITLPKVFADMEGGTIIGIAFFVMFLIAAMTSAISLVETSVSTFQDELHLSRPKGCLLATAIILVLGTGCALGYGVWDWVRILGMQILDFFDFLTNSIMMPIAGLATCFLILKAAGIEKIDQEVEASSRFPRKKVYHFFLRYLAPICISAILASSILNVLGIIHL